MEDRTISNIQEYSRKEQKATEQQRYEKKSSQHGLNSQLNKTWIEGIGKRERQKGDHNKCYPWSSILYTPYRAYYTMCIAT